MKRFWRVAQIVVSLVIVVGIFAGIIPKIASYSDVWRTITGLSGIQLVILFAITAFNVFSYWPQMVAAMPGLTLSQAAVNNQSSTSIANVFPGGGAIAVGVAYAMFHSWGFSGSDVALLISTTGIWNSFMKLALPIVSLLFLAITGKATKALLIPALVGLAILIGSVLLFALALRRKPFARSIGNGLGAAWSWLRKLVRKPPVTSWGEGAVRFRKQTIKLVAKRWVPLTVTTVVSHVGLYLVLLIALREVGVSEHVVSWAQVLAVFAFGRLITAIPITPGGVGFIELAYIGGLVVAGRHHTPLPQTEFKAQVTAAVLLFRALTYGVQIPLGAFTYLIWQRKKSWRKAPPLPVPSPPATRTSTP